MAKELTIEEKLAAAEARAAAAEAQSEKLRKGMDPKEFVPETIKGTFTAKWKTPSGEEVTKKMKFKDGHKAVRLSNELTKNTNGGNRVSTEGLMQLANAGKVDAKILEGSPLLKNLSKEQAQDYLTHLTQIQYGYLVEA